MRARAGLLACAAALVALAGCQVEREQVLPWLLKENLHAAFGGFGESTHSTYSTRHWGS